MHSPSGVSFSLYVSVFFFIPLASVKSTPKLHRLQQLSVASFRCICFMHMNVFMFTTCTLCAGRGHKRVPESLKLESQKVLSHYVGAGN